MSNKVSSTQIFNNKHLLHSIQPFQREVYSATTETRNPKPETQSMLGLTQNVTGSPTRPAYPFTNVLDSSNVKDLSNLKDPCNVKV